MGAWGLFIGTMLTTFPANILGAYGIDFFECPAKQPRGAPVCDEVKQKSVAYNMVAIAGIQAIFTAALCINFAREGVSQKAQWHSKPCIAQPQALSLTPLGSTRLPGSLRPVLHGDPGTCVVRGQRDHDPAQLAGGDAEGRPLLQHCALDDLHHPLILSYLGWKESGAALPDTDALIP